MNETSPSFSELFDTDKHRLDYRVGTLIDAKVIDVTKKFVIVDCGLKSETPLPIEQFADQGKQTEIHVGDTVQLALEAIEDGRGETKVSREKARRIQSWGEIQTALENGANLSGQVMHKIKGGYTVDVNGVRAFLPGSLVDIRPVKDATWLEGKTIEFKVIKIVQERNNIVVSRRAALAEEHSENREALLASLEPGMRVKGIVKNLIDYGAFVDLGGVDGLLYVTDISWKRIRHPSELLEIGQELELCVLRYEAEKERISLGLKQLTADPWDTIDLRYKPDTVVKGTVTNIADYGFFAEIEPGIEGLVHTSELDWTNKSIHASKLVNIGDEVDVMILALNKQERRLSLGYKQCCKNPWQDFADAHEKGEIVKGTIKSITDFGIFLGLNDNIDGLIHLSGISWNNISTEELNKKYKRGMELEAMIINMDVERERISLSLKHLVKDVFNSYVDDHKRGAIVTGSVLSVTPQKAEIQLGEGVTGEMNATEFSSQEVVQDITEKIHPGDSIQAQIIYIDKRNRKISLSIRAQEKQQQKEAIAAMKKKSQSTQAATIGALIKEQMEE